MGWSQTTTRPGCIMTEQSVLEGSSRREKKKRRSSSIHLTTARTKPARLPIADR